ncbi:ethanolamine ammonia-lyase subunit EutC [Donghicola eburneus]|uniref:ethanolamine ammonia-lyase subunit EutC n=1 Tax=Donghicola eburneus TaxID=393278 RepID=UPI0008E89EC4|nr:ethanolamine ammonia-lyase subunit EutC [Donghicola eburneus]SFQ57506.1 Ethanolamine ammonia-lyase light chain [Donghicola eburneus]
MSTPSDLPRRIFSPDTLERLKRFTDARIGLGQAGAAQPTKTVLRFALDHAKARDAISSEFDIDGLTQAFANGPWPLIAESAVTSREEYLTRPDLGRVLSEASQDALEQAGTECDLCIVVADGLSSLAVNQNAAPLIKALTERLPNDLKLGTVLLRNGRVATGDKIALALKAKAVLTLIGERPGLSAADSLGAYLTWKPRVDTRDSERYCVSNIRKGGMETGAAADLIRTLFDQSRVAGRSGVALPSPD